jgi:hypothetical protein
MITTPTPEKKRQKVPGSGKKKGTKNRSTLEKEKKALAALQAKAQAAVKGKPRGYGKEELEELVPIVKGAVAQFQRAALREDGTGTPGGANFDPKMWNLLREWIHLYERVCSRIAEFHYPRYGVIAVTTMPGVPGAEPAAPPKVIEHGPTDTAGRADRARETYLRLVKSSRDSAA